MPGMVLHRKRDGSATPMAAPCSQPARTGSGPCLGRRALLALPLLAVPGLVRAQGWEPTRPIRIIVGFAAGGGVDIATRAIAPRLGELLGQGIVVENRSGAGGNLAVEATVHAPADGYTLLMASPGALIVNPILFRDLGFVPSRDLVTVAMAANAFNVLTVRADRPWRSQAELIAAAKAQPGKLSWGHPGVGASPHLAGVQFDRLAGTQTVGVGYRGGGLVATDLIGGQIDFSFLTGSSAIGHIRAGRLRALAVPSRERSAMLPEVPTSIEAGLPGMVVENWYALLAPRGTPEAAVARIGVAVQEALRDPKVQEALTRAAVEPMFADAAAFAALWAQERERWEPIVRESGIKPE